MFNIYRRTHLLLCILILFFLGIIGCKSTNERIPQSKYYLDINSNTLEGVGETKSTNYPNIELRDSSGYRFLTYHIENNESFNHTYKKNKGVWSTNFQVDDDTATIYTIREHHSDKILEISYTDTLTHQLFDLGIWEQDKVIYYNPPKAVFINPNSINIDSIKKISAYQTIYSFDSTGEKVKIYTETILGPSQIRDTLVDCYQKLDRSFFWWLEFRDYLPAIQCK